LGLIGGFSISNFQKNSRLPLQNPDKYFDHPF